MNQPKTVIIPSFSALSVVCSLQKLTQCSPIRGGHLGKFRLNYPQFIVNCLKVKMAKTPLLILAAIISSSVTAAEVNLYTDRQEIFLRDVITAYEKQSGDKVNTLFVKRGLQQRAQAEGASSPADVFLVTDIGRLTDFVDAELTTPTTAPELQNISANLRDVNNHWFAVTQRARILFASPDVNVPTYAALAMPQYHNSICLRSGAHPYNNALFADIVGRVGEQQATQWLMSVKNNLARLPQGNDRAQINAVANGNCKVGIANSYYYFHLLNNATEDEKQKLRENVVPIFPQRPHINITGMARAKNAPHPEVAIRFMQFMLSKQAQEMLASRNFEFPVRTDVTYPPQLRPYRDNITNAKPHLLQTAKWRKMASEVAAQIGFDR